MRAPKAADTLQVRGCAIEVLRGDLTALGVDAIVNAANTKLVMGGGVAGAIKRKGGQAIEEEALGKGPIAVGDAVETAAGQLPCRYVIHAATMGMDFKTDEARVRQAARSAFALAQRLRVSSLAFPALGCGTGGFAYLAAAKIMAQEALRALRAPDSCLNKIIFCLFEEEAVAVFRSGVIGYLTHVTGELMWGPFVTVDCLIEQKGPGGESLVLIERSNPPLGVALPGGFVEYGESLEEAVAREAREETGLVLEGLRQFHTYSAPGRDPRFHTVATVFVARGRGEARAGDDAAGVRLVPLQGLSGLTYAFDHRSVIEDYLRFKQTGVLP